MIARPFISRTLTIGTGAGIARRTMMMPASAILRLGLMLLLCAAVLPAAALAQGKPSIPWNQDVSYSLTTVDEDIRLLLRRVVEADGNLRVILKPGVKGEATVQFRNVPLAAAFNQLIEEYDLDYTYRGAIRTITVFPKTQVVQARAIQRGFITLQAISFDAVRRALTTFGLGEEGVSFDAGSRTVSVFGTGDRVDGIRNLIERLDASALKRRKGRLERAAKGRTLALQRQLAEAEKQMMAVEKQRADTEQKILDRVIQFKVKVIRLRFANVSATTKTFQNQTVTIPGIEETLQKILGLPVTSTQSRVTATSATQNLFNQAGVVLPGTAPGARAGSPQTAAPAISPQAASRFADALRPVISIDPRTNSVIVRGTDEAIAQVEEIIRELDKPLRMIEIETVIVKADSSVTEDLGIAYLASANEQRGSIGRSGSVDTGVTTAERATASTAGVNALDLLPAQPSSGTAKTLATFLIADQGDVLQVELTALAEKNRIQMIASPTVVTLDNVTARITRAKNVFVQLAATGDSGDTIKEIQTGLEMSILPSIVPSDVAGEQDLIRLQLSVRNSTPTASSVGVVDVASSEVQTQVLVPDGATFVMAGLFDDTRTENERGIPFLKDLPLIGWLFRTNSSSDALVETIFFITPRIVDERQLLNKDIATRVGTREYMKRARNALARLSKSIETDKSRPFPNALRVLEEDE